MADDEFMDLYTAEPDRGEEIDDELSNVSASASERESSSPNDSDLTTILKRLFPSYDSEDIKRVLPIANEIKTISPIIMMGRVFPDNFSTKVYLIVTSLALRHQNDSNFDVIEAIMIVEGFCQIGLEGKGRVDALVASSNTIAQAEQEATRFGA